MRFKKIEWKNIFAYGEELQTIEYHDGELVLLKGQSGSGKSAVLSLPALLLYGKLEKLNKSSIANRTNKNGWIRGTIEKGKHTYVIERGFTPNTLTVIRDGENIDSYGVSSAQDYIDKEIADIPIQTFANMVSISMKKFKSFLTMSPADRKQIIDKVFNLEVVNIASEHIKKDAKEISNAINASNTTLFQLTQTLKKSTEELAKIEAENHSEEDAKEIEENLKKIEECNQKIDALNNGYGEYSLKQQTASNAISEIGRKIYENNSNIKVIVEKLDLFSKDKCPTCGASFQSEAHNNLKTQLEDLRKQKVDLSYELEKQKKEVNDSYNQITEYLGKISNAVYQLKTDIGNLTHANIMIKERAKMSSQYQGIRNIIDSTAEQIDSIKCTLADDTQRLKDLQNLAIVFSIDGVKQKVIVNYLPILNEEIERNLDALNFPYKLEIDCKFDPHLTELGKELAPETLSDGEQTRVDLVIMCSLFKLLKRRFPTINILFIDEVISSLDNESSGLVLSHLKDFAKDNGLACFIVSHTDLYLDNFDKILSVKKEGFSRIEELTTVA